MQSLFFIRTKTIITIKIRRTFYFIFKLFYCFHKILFAHCIFFCSVFFMFCVGITARWLVWFPFFRSLLTVRSVEKKSDEISNWKLIKTKPQFSPQQIYFTFDENLCITFVFKLNVSKEITKFETSFFWGVLWWYQHSLKIIKFDFSFLC